MERLLNEEIILNETIQKFQKKLDSREITPKEMLHGLAETGLFVFHGSDNPDIEELEPRQAYFRSKEDGKPAVCAIDFPDIAIFKSLIPGISGGWYGTREKGMNYVISDSSYKKMKNNVGFVYILDKNLFSPHKGDFGSGDLRSLERVNPLAKVRVDINDSPEFELLPQDELLKFWDERKEADLKK